MEIKDDNLGNLTKKAIYLNNSKYGHFPTHNTKNYKMSDWVPHEKIDLELASDYNDYTINWDEKLRLENEGPKEDSTDKDSD